MGVPPACFALPRTVPASKKCPWRWSYIPSALSAVPDAAATALASGASYSTGHMPDAPTPSPLDLILDTLREDARHKRDLGNRFERLTAAFLRSDPLYADKFSDVWLFNDWPDKGRIGDTGIDIVAKERATGAYPPSNGSWSATRSRWTKTAASATTPTTGPRSTSSPATSSTSSSGWCG